MEECSANLWRKEGWEVIIPSQNKKLLAMGANAYGGSSEEAMELTTNILSRNGLIERSKIHKKFAYNQDRRCGAVGRLE